MYLNYFQVGNNDLPTIGLCRYSQSTSEEKVPHIFACFHLFVSQQFINHIRRCIIFIRYIAVNLGNGVIFL